LLVSTDQTAHTFGIIPDVDEPKPRATDLSYGEIVSDYLDYFHHKAFFAALKDVVRDIIDKRVFTPSTKADEAN